MKKKMLSAVLLLAALLCLSAAAAATDLDDNSTPITLSNVWKDSDIRKYLNNGVTNGQPNSTTGAYNSANDSGYAAHFTDAEYALMKPTTVQTLKGAGGLFDVTTDRIFLPSGRSEKDGMKVLSWGQQDLVGMEVSNELDKTVLIPLGYWAAGDGRLWLRSAGTEPGEAMSYRRANGANPSNVYGSIGIEPSSVGDSLGVAPVFTLDATTIHFASSESAAVWASGLFQYGSTAIEKSDYLGSIDETPKNSPTYGMYLKTKYEGKDFRVKNLSCSGKGLSFEYIGGMPGDYVMIQAYGGDAFDRSVTGYAAAMRIEHGRGEMSVEMDGSSMAKMENYTFKIWMENPSRVNLAQATEPQTFSFKNGSFVEVNDAGAANLPKNLRMFAMKHELACSWGDLRDSRVSNVLAGKAVPNGVDNDLWIKGKSCGVNASNQIIYFGMESHSGPDGVISKPLRFWIAGRSGNNLTLYQMSTNEMHVFDKSPLTVETQMTISSDLPESESLKPGYVFTPELSGLGNTHHLISTNPHVAEVGPNGTVTIRNYGEFSLILFSRGKAVQTDTISVKNPNPPKYIPAGKWPDETQQAAADGLPQTGDSSVLPLWAALLALSLVGLMARRRRSA